MRVEAIQTDPKLQVREHLSTQTVCSYADCIEDMPPIEVFEDDDNLIYVVDGFHRLAAARQAEREYIRVRVLDIDRRQAVMRAATANARHGLRLSPGDLRRAVLMMQEASPESTQAQIAFAVGCSQPYVSKVLNTYEDEDDEAETESEPESPPPAGGDDLPHRQDDGDDIPDDDDNPFEPDNEPEPDDNIPLPTEIAKHAIEINRAIAAVSSTRRLLTEHKDSAGFHHIGNSAITDLRRVEDILRMAMPTRGCPKCNAEGCDFCYHTGWIVASQEKGLS